MLFICYQKRGQIFFKKFYLKLLIKSIEVFLKWTVLRISAFIRVNKKLTLQIPDNQINTK